MSICYLEVDDEITAAIKRIRAVTDGEALLVIPPASRIATSRINFRLIAREAAARRLNIAAVSDEPGVRALAISAGLPAYDSIASAEAALRAFREQDRQLAERLGQPAVAQATGSRPPRTRRLRHTTDTAVLPGQAPDAADAPTGQTAGTPGGTPGGPDGEGTSDQTAVLPAPRAARQRQRRRRRLAPLPMLVLALVVVLVAAVAYGAYVFLPTATITLHPSATLLTSPPYTITADPTVAVADQAAGVIGAQRLDLPLLVSGQFPASGTQVTLTTAHGTVRFRSTNTLNAVPVARGTLVSTADGVDFETTDAVVVPRADFSTGTAGTAEVRVRAMVDGPRGNVDAGTITKLPADLDAQLVKVTNPDPTTGGERNEQTVVQQADYEAALTALGQQLSTAAISAVADPANVPRGLTIYPATATLGNSEPDPTADAVVNTAAETFTLTLHGSVSVIAVNESLVDGLGESRFRSSLTAGEDVVGDQVTTSHDPGSVVGQTIVYQVTASAEVYTQPDEQDVVAAVSGKSVAEARQALAQYGEAEIKMWPDFIDHLPDQAARIRVTVVPPQPGT